MRGANEQRAVMERILKVWQEYPELRLGQLLENCNLSSPLFYITDFDLVMDVESYNPERVK